MLTGQRTELASAVAREHRDGGHGGRGRALVNLALQAPNTLLHDGHAWRPDAPAHVISSTRRMLAEAGRTRSGFVVHGSYAFVGNAELGGHVDDGLRDIVEAAQVAERMVLASGRRACVVRLGYLYGPEYGDLLAYRRAFRLGRPYWAGPKDNLQHHLHSRDAARALLLAAARRPKADVVYATDGEPASFAEFMDHFAHLVGRSRPLHLPRFTAPLVRPVVRGLHRQMVDLAAIGPAVPRLPGFEPMYPDHRSGLAQVIEAWQQSR